MNRKYSKWSILSILLVVSAGLLSGCTNTSGPSSALALGSTTGGAGDLQVVSLLPPPSNTRDGADQLIAENDLLEVDVFQVDELDRTVRVDSNGRISMPLIGTVQVAGKTIAKIQQELQARYGAKYLQSPEITVFLKESSSRRVTMDGEFRKPGLYPTTNNSSLLQAVALAGGFSKLADEKKIFVFRQIGDKKMVANYSIADIRAGKSRDPRLFGGDVVVAFTSSAKVATQNLKEALGLAASASRLATPF